MIRIRQTDGNIVVTNEKRLTKDAAQITPILVCNDKFALFLAVYALFGMLLLIFALTRTTGKITAENKPKEYKASLASYVPVFDASENCEKEENEDEEIYAGRYSKAENTNYNSLGLPNDRLWLTSSEWQGKHIESYELKARFKAWKTLHIAEWVQYITAAAKEESKVYPFIPWQLIAAQATLESNFGLSEVAVKGRNLFGHKCYGCDAQKGEAIIAHDDSPTDHFRVNRSKWASIRAHSDLLTRKYYPRISVDLKKPTLNNWLDALCGCQDPQKAFKMVVGTGNPNKPKTWNGIKTYATSCYKGKKGRAYTSKLKSIINQYFSK